MRVPNWDEQEQRRAESIGGLIASVFLLFGVLTMMALIHPREVTAVLLWVLGY